MEAVLFAVKAQQRLLLATWPEALMRHERVGEGGAGGRANHCKCQHGLYRTPFSPCLQGPGFG